jgi:hypothetical protein
VDVGVTSCPFLLSGYKNNIVIVKKMYLMYVDESGDCGLINSPTRYFILSGLVVHETCWQRCFEEILEFRRRMKQSFGLRLRDEFHSHHFINRPGELAKIKRNDRLTIVRTFADQLASMSDIRMINIVVDKDEKPDTFDVFDTAWRALIQRFHNTLEYKNFPNPLHSNEHGIIFPDRTDDKKLTQLLRKMRRYNPVPSQMIPGESRNLVLTRITEDPNFRDSSHSYFIQATDLVAYLLQQHLQPCSYMKKKSGQNYFRRLEPILCKVASKSDPYGIVRL